MTDRVRILVPVEEDTRILTSAVSQIGKFEVLMQTWYWDGILGSSYIFSDADVSRLSDKELEEAARSTPDVKPDSAITLKRGESGFTFVNFNFEVL